MASRPRRKTTKYISDEQFFDGRRTRNRPPQPDRPKRKVTKALGGLDNNVKKTTPTSRTRNKIRNATSTAIKRKESSSSFSSCSSSSNGDEEDTLAITLAKNRETLLTHPIKPRPKPINLRIPKGCATNGSEFLNFKYLGQPFDVSVPTGSNVGDFIRVHLGLSACNDGRFVIEEMEIIKDNNVNDVPIETRPKPINLRIPEGCATDGSDSVNFTYHGQTFDVPVPAGSEVGDLMQIQLGPSLSNDGRFVIEKMEIVPGNNDSARQISAKSANNFCQIMTTPSPSSTMQPIDNSFSLVLRVDFNKVGGDRISDSKLRIFDSQFDNVNIPDCTISFKHSVLPNIMYTMKRLYEVDGKISSIFTTPSSSGRSEYVYVRAVRLDATIYKRGQKRRSTKEILAFDINQDDVDSVWQNLLREKGANLTEFARPSPEKMAKTTHLGAIEGLGERRVVFDMMLPYRLKKKRNATHITNANEVPSQLKSPSNTRRKLNDSVTTVGVPRKVKVDVLLPVKKKGVVCKAENGTPAGTVVIDISFLFTDGSDLYPDCVNLGRFRKRLLIDACKKVKAYSIKKEVVSKDCSLFHFPGTTGCTASEIRTSEQLNDLIVDIHSKNVRMKNFKECDYNVLKMRLAFGRRDVEDGQVALCDDDLTENMSDISYSQNEPDSPAVQYDNRQKRYDSQIAPIEIGVFLDKMYHDDDDGNPLYHGFYFQMKAAIKRAYIHSIGPINRKLSKMIDECMKKGTYPFGSDFNALFGQSHVRANCNNSVICRGKYPPLNGDMPCIEPTKSTKEKDDNVICNVVDIMGRLASVAEKNSGMNSTPNVVKTVIESQSSQVITLHFTKRDYDMPFPVNATKLDTPLIEYVKEARERNKYFFAFKTVCRDHLRNKTGEIVVTCKEANLTVTLDQLKTEQDLYTVRNLYNMSDVKTNHHHISFSVQVKLVQEEDEEIEDFTFE